MVIDTSPRRQRRMPVIPSLAPQACVASHPLHKMADLPFGGRGQGSHSDADRTTGAEQEPMEATQLATCRDRLYSRVPLMGLWLRRRALRTLASDGSAEAVRVLAAAAVQDGVGGISSGAFDALVRLAEEGNVPAQEALCRLVMHHNHPAAR